jgi:hypothetical protein
MYDYLKGQLIQITEELNNLVYDIDRQYYDELILRHRTITNVIYMSREYKDVDIFVLILKDKIRLEQLSMRAYTKRYFANDINYEEYSDLTNESEIVIEIYSEVIEFIDSHK